MLPCTLIAKHFKRYLDIIPLFIFCFLFVCFYTHRNTAKCRKKVGSLEEEVKEMESRINELQDTLSALEQEAKEVIAAQEKLRVMWFNVPYWGGGGGGALFW